MKKLLLASALVFGLTATIPSLASAYVMCRPNDWMWCNWPPSQRYPSTQPQQYPSTQPRQYPSTKEIEAEAKPEPAPAKQTTPYEQIVAVLDGWNRQATSTNPETQKKGRRLRAAFDAECLSKWGNHAAVLECIDTITKVPAHAENNNLIAMTVIYYTQCDKSAYSENTVRYLQTYVEAHKEAVMKASDWSFQLVQGWIQNGSTESDAWQLWCHSHQRPMNVFAEVLNRTIKTETVR